MDRRKLKLKSGLHKNLIPESQLTSRSASTISDIRSQQSIISNHGSSTSTTSNNNPLESSTSSKTILARTVREKRIDTLRSDVDSKQINRRKRRVENTDIEDDDYNNHMSPKKRPNMSKHKSPIYTSDSDNDAHTSSENSRIERGNVTLLPINKEIKSSGISSSTPKKTDTDNVLGTSFGKNTKKKSNTAFLVSKSGTNTSTYSNQRVLRSSLLEPTKTNTAKNKDGSQEVFLAKQKTPSKSQTIFDDSDDSPAKLSAPKQSQASKVEHIGSIQKSIKHVVSNTRSVNPSVQQKSEGHCEYPSNLNCIEAYGNMPKRLQEFLNTCGITVNSARIFCISEEPLIVKGKINDMLVDGQYNNREIVRLVEEYIEDDENLQSLLNDMEIPGGYKVYFSFCNMSLARLMLQVSQLQTDICTCLITKLMDSLLIADSAEKVPWRLLLLQQIRFLETVSDTNSLMSNIERLLESCPLIFQKELIIFIPDIVPDAKHHAIAEMLSTLMGEESDLISVILDCISKLTLGKEYLEQYREKALDLLKGNFNRNIVPDIIRFALNDSPNIPIMQKVISVLRQIEMQPLAGEELKICFANQIEIMNTLKISILLSKGFVQIVLSVLKEITKDPKPIDIIFLLLIFQTHPAKRKIIESIFKQHIRSGFYRRSLLNLLYTDFKEVARELQPAALLLASNLLRSDDYTISDFGAAWFQLQFVAQANTIHKQREIIERITLLMGNNDQTAKNALRILSNMVTKEEEKKALQAHSNHLRILLEKMDNWDLETVGILCDILHSLCAGANSSAESLQDDLNILLQKQLANTRPFTKCKGVLGAVMAIKHLASTAENSNAALTLFTKVLSGVRNCTRSKALFYDQLAQVIEHTENIDKRFLEMIKTHTEEEFITTHLLDKSTYKGDLVAQYGLNNTEAEFEESAVYFGEEKHGAIVAISFKLLKTCCIRLSDNGDLADIDALLGSSIMMPKNFDSLEHSDTDLLLHCINWFREIINGFVTQDNPLLHGQVLKRLDNLMTLQDELSTVPSLYDIKYQPPLCYLHHFPAPAFVRGDKKPIKKGKKGSPNKSTLSQTESWEVGSVICLKNPAYFRKLDAKIAHLLNVEMAVPSTQVESGSISISQACFIGKELLGMLESEPTESFIRDLIHLLPKVCAKLQDIVADLKEHDSNQNSEAVQLLLCLLTALFDWKGFQSLAHQMLLRDGLRTIAGLINEENAMLRSCKELVAESYKYFESLCEIGTKISLAVAIVNACKVLMKHSTSYAERNKDKQAKMAFGFLCLEWPEDKHSGVTYKTGINVLLNNWIDNEPSPLDTVTIVLQWLPDETAKLVKLQDHLSKIPSINKLHFHLLYRKLFDGLIKGIKISLSSAETDSERIKVWNKAAKNVQKLADICKFVKKNCVLLFLRYMTTLLKVFMHSGMPILEHNLKYKTDDVTGILKAMQGGTRYLHAICCHSEEQKDVSLSKYVPAAKSMLEQLIYSVKGMLVLNNSPAAFWMGSLRNKNLDGQEILSETSSESSNTANLESMTDDITNASSEMIDNASDNDLDENENDDDEVMEEDENSM